MRTFVLTTLAAMLVLSAGCATTTQSYDERLNTNRLSIDNDMRQLADDWDHIWMIDRQYRLSRWHTR